MTTMKRTQISFLNGRPTIYLVGWRNSAALLAIHPSALIEHGWWYRGAGDTAERFHPKYGLQLMQDLLPIPVYGTETNHLLEVRRVNATASRGTRVMVRSGNTTRYFAWDNRLSETLNYDKCAQQFAGCMNWLDYGQVIFGAMHSEGKHFYVIASRRLVQRAAGAPFGSNSGSDQP